MLKILWIGMILLGLALILAGAIGGYYHKGTFPMVAVGMSCMGMGMLARRAYFKQR